TGSALRSSYEVRYERRCAEPVRRGAAVDQGPTGACAASGAACDPKHCCRSTWVIALLALGVPAVQWARPETSVPSVRLVRQVKALGREGASRVEKMEKDVGFYQFSFPGRYLGHRAARLWFATHSRSGVCSTDGAMTRAGASRRCVPRRSLGMWVR